MPTYAVEISATASTTLSPKRGNAVPANAVTAESKAL